MEFIQMSKLTETLLTFNAFIVKNFNFPAEFFIETNQLLREALAKGNVKALKMAENEMVLQIKQMSLETKKELKEFFRLNDIDTNALIDFTSNVIQKIKKNGRIKNKEDYETALEYLDEIHSDTNRLEEIKVLNDILAKFHIENAEENQ